MWVGVEPTVDHAIVTLSATLPTVVAYLVKVIKNYPSLYIYIDTAVLVEFYI